MTGETPPKTRIELTEEDAQAFLVFRRHQANIVLLIEAEVFEVRKGDVVISFQRRRCDYEHRWAHKLVPPQGA
jgi:hypothetical protein